MGQLRPGQPWAGHLVRFSTGLEAAADLQADLAQSLAAAFGAESRG
jgi:cystathionine beta-lyase/cystathionine gamma-synthase